MPPPLPSSQDPRQPTQEDGQGANSENGKLQALKISIPFDPTTLILGIYPKEIIYLGK